MARSFKSGGAAFRMTTSIGASQGQHQIGDQCGLDAARRGSVWREENGDVDIAERCGRAACLRAEQIGGYHRIGDEDRFQRASINRHARIFALTRESVKPPPDHVGSVRPKTSAAHPGLVLSSAKLSCRIHIGHRKPVATESECRWGRIQPCRLCCRPLPRLLDLRAGLDDRTELRVACSSANDSAISSANSARSGTRSRSALRPQQSWPS
jgi:hypothetical protein